MPFTYDPIVLVTLVGVIFSAICASKPDLSSVTLSAVKAASTQPCTLAASRLPKAVKLEILSVSSPWLP
jgi:hypothetical protein